MAALILVLHAVVWVEGDNPLVAPFLSYNSSFRNGGAVVVDGEWIGGGMEEDILAVE